jgi:hypothetical protein
VIATSIATSQALDVIRRALAPYIGRTMADASLRMHCERLGIGQGGTIGVDDLERLITRLSGALSVFVGAQTAEQLVASIRQGLDNGGRQAGDK